MSLPRIILHGGYINESNLSSKPGRQASVRRILEQAQQFSQTPLPPDFLPVSPVSPLSHPACTTNSYVSSNFSPVFPTSTQIAVYTVSLLENDPLFNAGTGSRIQSDGIIRMTASLIDSEKRKFSGVLNIERVQNPAKIALLLQNEETDTVLAGPQALKWARDHGFGDYDPEIPMRREEFERIEAKRTLERGETSVQNGQNGQNGQNDAQNGQNAQETQNALQNVPPEKPRTGTVGCVVLHNGILASCTSTGGKGNETPGRVSDSGNPSGCFVNKVCGVSITGVGEHAMASSMASAICVRREMMGLKEALGRTLEDLKSFGGISGAICLDLEGNFAYESTESGMVWGLHDGVELNVFE